MEFKLIIQDKQSNGSLFIRTLPLDPSFVSEAFEVREACGNSYCIFILEYCSN
jgi:hypothetical protein